MKNKKKKMGAVMRNAQEEMKKHANRG